MELLLKTHNSPVSIEDLMEELDMRDVKCRCGDTGVWVDEDDYDYALGVLSEMEMGDME